MRVSIRFAAMAAVALMFRTVTSAQAPVLPAAPLAATSFTGSDIGERVNKALKACALQCTVYIPAGTYSFSSTIMLELNPFGKYKLMGDPGAVLQYTGSGSAIMTEVESLAGVSQLLIEGFQLIGNAHAMAGIHTMPTNRITIRNMVISQFASGDGILVEGTNSSNIYDNLITNNRNGIRLIPTLCKNSKPIHCGISETDQPYTANAIHVTDNQIVSNSNWGIFEDTVVVGHGLTEALNNLYMANNLELNGGAIYLTRSRGTVIEANYFEQSPREIVIGIPNAGSGYRAYGTVVRDNFFTTEAKTAYNIELQNADNAMIQGNSESVASVGTRNCFVNITGSTRTWISKNALYQKNSICTNGAPGSPSTSDGSYFFGQP